MTVVAREPIALPLGTPSPQGAGSCGCKPHQTGPVEPSKETCSCKKMAVYRRAHSAAGVVFAAFLIVHLVIATTAASPAKFDQNSAALETLAHNIPAGPILAVLLPVLILILSGLHLLAKQGLRYNVKKCKRGGKLRYFLQRSTAVVVLLFLAFHLLTFSRWALWRVYDPGKSFASASAGVRTFFSSLPPSHPLNLMVLGFYLLGILAVVYHLFNGLWTGAHAWNFLPTPQRERNWGRACAVMGLVVAGIGIRAWMAFLH